MDIKNINTDYIIIFLLFIIIIINLIIYIKKNNYKLIDNFENQDNLQPYNNLVTVINNSDAINTWGNWLINTNFPDKCASWIWYQTFNKNNPIDSNRFSLNYIYDYKVPFSNINNNSFLYVICDASCIVYHNNIKVGTCYNGWNTNPIPSSNIIPLTLQPGLNYFKFIVSNSGGVSGFLCSVIDNYGTVLFNSNKSWTFTNHGIITTNDIIYSVSNTC
jgi:hypothetical protein